MSMMGPAIPGAAFAAAAKLGPVDSLLAAFNTNPYFIGLMMLLLNLGGRFLALEVTKGQEQFLSQPLVRRGLIFVVLFIATRNVVIAFWLWLAIILSLGYLFNENSAFCVFGKGGRAGSTCAAAPDPQGRPGPAPPKPTDQELSIYKMLSEKVKTFEAFQNQADAEADATSAILKPVVPSVVQTQDQAPAQAQTQTATPAVQPIQSATITEPTDKALIKKTLDQSELQQRLAAQNALSQVSL
jgi:hypothetical protein